MILPRFSEPIASIAEHLTPCPTCGTKARVGGGTCVNCLLLAGLDQTLVVETENFDGLLREIDVYDLDDAPNTAGDVAPPLRRSGLRSGSERDANSGTNTDC
ncbi:MAG: hypothetical protein ABIR71_12165 [Chthoniobacterales bacterium]